MKDGIENLASHRLNALISEFGWFNLLFGGPLIEGVQI